MGMFSSLIERRFESGVFRAPTEEVCDTHWRQKRQAVLSMIGEIDSIGAEYVNMCVDCVKKVLKHRCLQEQAIKEGRAIKFGYCDECGCDVCGEILTYVDPEDSSNRKDLCPKHYDLEKAKDAVANAYDLWQFEEECSQEDGVPNSLGTYEAYKEKLQAKRDKINATPDPRPYDDWEAERALLNANSLAGSVQTLKDRLMAKYGNRLMAR